MENKTGGPKLNKMLKHTKGFTLVELMVVIIIIGVLAAVSVPAYKNYVNKGIASEGQALVVAVAAAEKRYFADHNQCLDVPSFSGGGANDPLGVVATQNMYFTVYQVNPGGGGGLSYGVVTYYNDPSGAHFQITLNQALGAPEAQPVVYVDGVLLN
jgi:prepilin-type N-terminal cleavage/methylation domain-containing protein